jgi:hypothetical protein
MFVPSRENINQKKRETKPVTSAVGYRSKEEAKYSSSSCPRNKKRRNWTLANIYQEKGAL